VLALWNVGYYQWQLYRGCWTDTLCSSIQNYALFGLWWPPMARSRSILWSNLPLPRGTCIALSQEEKILWYPSPTSQRARGYNVVQCFWLDVYYVPEFLTFFAFFGVNCAVGLHGWPIVSDSEYFGQRSPRSSMKPTHSLMQLFQDVLDFLFDSYHTSSISIAKHLVWSLLTLGLFIICWTTERWWLLSFVLANFNNKSAWALRSRFLCSTLVEGKMSKSLQTLW